MTKKKLQNSESKPLTTAEAKLLRQGDALRFIVTENGFEKGERVFYSQRYNNSCTELFVTRDKDNYGQKLVVKTVSLSKGYNADTIEALTEDLEACEGKKAKIDEEIKLILDKIAFLRKHKLTIFDDESWKAVRVLERLKLGSIEEAKDIMSILKS